MVEYAAVSAVGAVSQHLITIGQDICDRAGRVKSNKKQSKSLARYVRTLVVPLHLRACSPEACQLVIQELTEIEKFLEQFEPSQPWFRQLILWKNSAEIRAEFSRHKESLQRLIDTLEFLSKTAAQQPVDTHTVASSSAYHAPISTIDHTPTRTVTSLHSNTSPPIHAFTTESGAQQAVTATTAVQAAAQLQVAPTIALPYTCLAGISDNATNRQRAPKVTATAPPPSMGTAGECILSFCSAGCRASSICLHYNTCLSNDRAVHFKRTDSKRRQDCLNLLNVLYNNDENQVSSFVTVYTHYIPYTNCSFTMYLMQCFTVKQDVGPLILNSIGRSVSECSAILAIMQRYCNDSEMQMWACAAITSHALKSIEDKQQLGNDGACRLVLTAMKMNSQFAEDTNAEVAKWGCKALVSLLSDSTSNRCILRSFDVKTTLAAAKATNYSDQELATEADDVLFHVTPQIPRGSVGILSLILTL
jgi:hypothetical protein